MTAAAWSAPAILASAAIPQYSASKTTPTLEYGLYVSTGFSGSRVGHVQSGEGTVPAPTTVAGYWEAVKNGRSPEADFSWSDATSSITNKRAQWYSNGEGSFPPVTNVDTPAKGAYAPTSGFWFSVPVPSNEAQTGNGYIPNSTATLKAGATFVTDVVINIPAQADFLLNGNNQSNTGIVINNFNTKWNTQRTGPIDEKKAIADNHFIYSKIASTFTAPKPTVTINPDGSGTLRGTITVTTNRDTKLTYDSKTKRYYGQVIILPTLSINTNYSSPSSYFELTSRVASARIDYTTPQDGSSSITLTDALKTTSFLQGW